MTSAEWGADRLNTSPEIVLFTFMVIFVNNLSPGTCHVPSEHFEWLESWNQDSGMRVQPDSVLNSRIYPNVHLQEFVPGCGWWSDSQHLYGRVVAASHVHLPLKSNTRPPINWPWSNWPRGYAAWNLYDVQSIKKGDMFQWHSSSRTWSMLEELPWDIKDEHVFISSCCQCSLSPTELTGRPSLHH